MALTEGRQSWESRRALQPPRRGLGPAFAAMPAGMFGY
jgi:hypothetical protein